MVLLSSSTVSAILSSGIICLFTFLLFLSGYVLQQNAVDGLRIALEAPLEQRVRLPSLPPPILDEVLNEATDENITFSGILEPTIPPPQLLISQPDQPSEQSPQELWHSHVDNSGLSTEIEDTFDPPSSNFIYDGRFAYVLALSSPSDVCSSSLFTQWHRQFTTLPLSTINIIVLYPASWETSNHPLHSSALQLLLASEQSHSLILHPVPISRVWTGIDVEQQLLTELARNPWPYDRVMYLRSPGMLLDTAKLDSTLTSTFNDLSLLKTSWLKLRGPRRNAPRHPDVMLFAQGKGLMVPIGGLARTLTARAKTSHANNHHDEIKDEFLAKQAAYILFKEEELAHRKAEKLNHNGIFERFEREREAVCAGTGLLG